MSNHLAMDKVQAGWSQRKISEAVGVDRKTIRRLLKQGASKGASAPSEAPTGLQLPLLHITNLISQAIESVRGTIFGDTITGNGLSNLLYGMEGNDSIFGGDGNDQLYPGTGDDQLQGGSGNDSYKFTGNVALGTDTIFESVGEGTADSIDLYGFDAGVGASIDLRSVGTSLVLGTPSNPLLRLVNLSAQNIEIVYGTRYGDTIAGNDLNNELYGREGVDTLVGGGGVDQFIGGNDANYIFFPRR